MSSSIISPFPFFTDTTGAPLEAGYIYIGQSNLNPETAPVNIFWDAALTIPAAQPVRTVGGYPSRQGTPSRFYSATDTYSITVRNKNRALVFSAFDQSDAPTSVFDISTQVIVATASQVTFTLTTFSYLPATDTLEVYRNGLRLRLNSDYIETNSTTVTLTSPATAGDEFLFQGGTVRVGNQTPGTAVSFIQAGAGAVTRNMQEKAREIVSVKDFGAVGDGVTDDTTAIQTAINSISANGGQVLFPSGNYKTTAELLVSSSNVSIVGDSMLSSRILRYGNGNTLRFEAGSLLSFVGVSNLAFQGQNASAQGVHVVFKKCYTVTVNNVSVSDGWSGIEFNSTVNARVQDINMSFNNTITGSSGRYGVRFANDSFVSGGPYNSGDNFVSNANIWLGTIIQSPLQIVANSDYGFLVDGIDGLWISNAHVACSKTSNFYFGNTTGKIIGNIYITNTMSDHCVLHGVSLEGSTFINTFCFDSGRISSLGLGSTGGNGLQILAPCGDVRFSGSVEGSNGNGIYINNTNANGIVISDFLIINNNADYPVTPVGDGILIDSGLNVTICNGVINGVSKQNSGLRLTGANTTRFVLVSNISVINHVSSGISLDYTTNNIEDVTITGSDFRSNNTNPYVITGTPNLLLVENCFGISPIIKTFTWTPGSIPNESQVYTAVTVDGVTTKDFVQIGYGSQRSGVIVTAYVEYDNLVVVLITNNTGASVTLGATTFKIKVEKFFSTN